MTTFDEKQRGFGILTKTALLAWLVTLVTLTIFLVVLLPDQRKVFLDNLRSKSLGIVASLRDVTASAVVTEDYSAVVDHCILLLKGDQSVEYLVLTREDGFSLVHLQNAWRVDNLPTSWHIDNREPIWGIAQRELIDRPVFHYAQPFDYSGIQWGWIHIGLSLKAYHRNLRDVYYRTTLLTLLCILSALVASLVYARRLTAPLLQLREAVHQVASGDLSVRAEVHSGDEVESLGQAFNRMTEVLLQRDRILQSVRFAAQQFLKSADWHDVIDGVLAVFGSSAQVSRVFLFENSGKEDDLRSSLRYEWCSPNISSQLDNPVLKNLSVMQGDYRLVAEKLLANQLVCSMLADMSPGLRNLLEPISVQSMLLAPVFVSQRWWGFIGLNECCRERIWTLAEMESLRAAADTLSSAIERQRVQDELLKAKKAAEAANQAKSQFLANMSHEIRTPITGVMGLLQLLQRSPLSTRQEHYIDHALISAETLLAIVEDVLDFSKIEAGRFSLDEVRIQVRDVIDTAIRVSAEQAEKKEIDLVTYVHPDVPRRLTGDPVRLRQILINLIGNAVKFMDRGYVYVECLLLEQISNDVTLRFQVCDTGPGVPKNHQTMIFESFSQSDSSMKRRHGGSGLGLAICHQLVGLMQGSISVFSDVGSGATFTFTIKLRKSHHPMEQAVARHGLGGEKILIVDNCEKVCQCLMRILTEWGGECDAAQNAAMALHRMQEAAAQAKPYSMALLDANMPGIDGLKLACMIKTDDALNRTKLILLGGFSRTEETAQLTNFVASIFKPVRANDLYDILVSVGQGEHPLNAMQPEEKAAVESAPPVGKGRLLLAEDNEINREVAEAMINELGYLCESVCNGSAAVEKVQTETFDLVLMDCQMPEMDGYEATRAIRSWEKNAADGRRIPIIALTAHVMKGDRERCLEAGMDDYLTKPLDQEKISQTIAKWFKV